MLPTALDNFLAEELNILYTLEMDHIVDPTPKCVEVTLRFLDVCALLNILYVNLIIKYVQFFILTLDPDAASVVHGIAQAHDSRVASQHPSATNQANHASNERDLSEKIGSRGRESMELSKIPQVA